LEKLIVFLILIFTLSSCSDKTKKNYYSNGKKKWDAPFDKDKKLNGIFRKYDSTGHVLFETEVIHDTLSGFIKTFYPSGKIFSLFYYKRGMYNNAVYSDQNIFAEYNYTNVKSYHFNENGKLERYMTQIDCHNDTCHGMNVKYKNDSIIEIWGNPETSLGKVSSSLMFCKTLLSVGNIPKCKTQFYVLDTIGNILFKGGNDTISIELDAHKNISLKVEYTDSIYKIAHSILEPIKQFRIGNDIIWSIGTYTIWDSGRYVKSSSTRP
jgi:hypothetical protein